MQLLLTLRTARYLRPRQILARLWKAVPRPPVRLRGPVAARPADGRLPDPPERPASLLGPTTLWELNRAGELATPEDWRRSPHGRLWLYHAHYFDDLNAEGSHGRTAWHQALIERWIGENPPGAGTGWEAYPLSRRIVNWIRHALRTGTPGRVRLESLAVQAATLAGRLEFDLSANHLLVNAKALVFAGCYLNAPASPGWLGRGLSILARELDEQILADGGHYERSPMYHSLVFEDLLDLIALARLYPAQIPEGMLATLRAKAALMHAWLEQMCHPDGRISFFNDSTFGVAAEPAALFAYARRCGVAPAAVELGESGYVRLAQGDTVVLFDAGRIGPDHQPGHAHADTLSFELSHAGRRLLVNSGISTYAPGLARQAERGTAAHNTLRVDGCDQSEVWAAFRVARRARPQNVQTDRATWIEATHDGYRRLPEPVLHHRRLELGEDSLIIVDHLRGAGRHRAELFFHLAPEASAALLLDPALERRAHTTDYHPGFYLSVPKRTVSGQWQGPLPVRFLTRIRLEAPPETGRSNRETRHERALHR
jgi:uncharacterized heparinase superfamily protein